MKRKTHGKLNIQKTNYQRCCKLVAVPNLFVGAVTGFFCCHEMVATRQHADHVGEGTKHEGP